MPVIAISRPKADGAMILRDQILTHPETKPRSANSFSGKEWLEDPPTGRLVHPTSVIRDGDADPFCARRPDCRVPAAYCQTTTSSTHSIYCIPDQIGKNLANLDVKTYK